MTVCHESPPRGALRAWAKLKLACALWLLAHALRDDGRPDFTKDDEAWGACAGRSYSIPALHRKLRLIDWVLTRPSTNLDGNNSECYKASRMR